MRTQQQSLLSLLEVPEEIIGMSTAIAKARVIMNALAKDYEAGRDYLVDAINETAEREGMSIAKSGGKNITKDTFDKWLQVNAEKHAPNFEAIVCFCLVVKSFKPLGPIFQALRLEVIRKEEIPYLKLGKATVKHKESQKELKEAEALFK